MSKTSDEQLQIATMDSFLQYGAELDWKPEYLVASSWLQHIPFAFWLINTSRPNCFVELGTHYGASYFAFCQAVSRINLSTRCFAVDTWEGDSQAGQYGHEVFDAVELINRQKYASFSSLLKMSFDEARNCFGDKEIDLLHIDGFHSYEAVSHDFENWVSAMSDKGVILLHDINVRSPDFGVWKFWNELELKYPHFSFHHGFGLGIVLVGKKVKNTLAEMCTLSDFCDRAQYVRNIFAGRGESILNSYRIVEYIKQVNEYYKIEDEYEKLKIKYLEEETKNKVAYADLENKKNEIFAAYNNIERSLSWRITSPLRSAKALLRKKLIRKFFCLLQKITVIRHCFGRRLDSAIKKTMKNGCIQSKEINVVWVGGEPDTPGYCYRVKRPAEAAKAAGANATYCRLDAIDDHLESLKAANIIIIWRAAWDKNVAKIFKIAHSTGCIICFDLDDLMFDTRLATAKFIDGIRSQSLLEEQVKAFYTRIHRTMISADFCIATTDELADHMRAFGKITYVIPNGFDEESFLVSRLAARRQRLLKKDARLRIGYAGGSRTHQRDFSLCIKALVRILKKYDNIVVVLFKNNNIPLVDLNEYPALLEFENRIEWRDMVSIDCLPNELARFDINIAPVEPGNFFCESKSELKFFEAAIVDVCTIASPTGPFKRAIRHKETGFLAATENDWFEAILYLVEYPEERKAMAHKAMLDVLWRFGPEQRTAIVSSFLEQIGGGRRGARAFAFDIQVSKSKLPSLTVPKSEVVFINDRLANSEVTVVVPLYNYEMYVIEALESVVQQDIKDIDLVVVDDASTDNSLNIVLDWAEAKKERFNRLLVLQNVKNSKLGPTRNVGFYVAETPYVFPLDADNIILPKCISKCLSVIKQYNAAFVFPKIVTFCNKQYEMGLGGYIPLRFVGGNYIDAMALVSKGCWSRVGGYEDVPYGWEDYEFWCRMAEVGMLGVSAGNEVLAKYRVHNDSMLTVSTNIPANFNVLKDYIKNKHHWVRISADTVDKYFNNNE